jgi:peptidyl-prolyl cis-trans isomerase D
MLESLRKHASGWIAKILMGLLVVSFAIWGIGDIFTGGGTREVAEIGSVKIGTEDFRQEYQERLQQVGRQIGRGLTPEQARALGLDRQILGEMISEATLDQKVGDFRLGITDQALLARIHANEAFRGPNGSFDINRFQEALRSAGYTEGRYVNAERRLMLRQQLGAGLGAGIAAPDVLRDAIRRFENEQRTAEFVTLTREQAGDIPAPSPAELESYFKENQAAFRAPEYRKLVVLPLTAQTLAAEMKVSDEEVKKVYDSIKDRLGEPERRQVDQLIVADEAEANRIAERLAAGASFDEIVADRNLKPADVSLGLVSRREILDPAVAEAVFSLPANTISQPVKGQFGTVFARVTRIEPGKQPTFEQVEAELRKDIATRRARNMILDRHDQIEDERAAGSTLAEVANKVGSKAITIEAVDRSGRGPDGKPIEGVPALNQLLPEAFDSAVGVEADPVEVNNGEGYIWYEVVEVTPSRERSFEEVRELVETRWRNEQIAKRLAERAEAIRSKLDAGETFQTAAPNLKVETREKIQRGTDAAGLSERTLASIFETPAGRAGVGPAEEGVGRIVFKVTGIDVPTTAATQSRRLAELDLGVQDDILVQYVLHLQEQLGVRVNETALRSVTGGGN